MNETYTLNRKAGSTEIVSITCHRCGLTSYNIHDIAQKYCGYCKRFHDHVFPVPIAEETVDQVIDDITNNSHVKRFMLTTVLVGITILIITVYLLIIQ